MKAKNRAMPDDPRPEYEFDYSTAIRGKYYRRLLKEGANVVVLLHPPTRLHWTRWTGGTPTSSRR